MPLEAVTFRQSTQGKKVAAQQTKPNLMLVVDRSQSMNFPIGNGVNESRWQQLKVAFDTYLNQHGTVARMGLMTFPTGDACGAGGVVVGLPNGETTAELQAQAKTINQAIQNTNPGGVTPTLDTLKALLDYAPMQNGGENIAVLATDGLPNCNANNPNSYDVDPTACDCTFASNMCGGMYSRLSCIDREGTVGVVRQLLQRGIKTAVVGFGADTLQGVGPQVMNAIASEGGAPRTCPNGSDAECGSNNACNPTTHVCDMRYYQANSAAELADALASIGYDLGRGDACVYSLEVKPRDERFLTVLLDGNTVDPGANGYSYADGTVTFTGDACARLRVSTSAAPVNLEFRTLEVL